MNILDECRAKWAAEEKEARDFAEKLRNDAMWGGARRIDISRYDSEKFQRFLKMENDAWEADGKKFGSPIGPRPYPNIHYDIVFAYVPVRLYQPETKVVTWDAREQWLVLSATCYTPEPTK